MSSLVADCQYSLLVLLLFLLELVGGDKCFSCGSARISSAKFKNGTMANYFKTLPYVANKTCDTMSKYLPVVPCTTVCIKVNLLENNDRLHPIVIRDCWSRVLKEPKVPKKIKHNRLAMVDQFGEEVGHLNLCTGFLCNWCSCALVSHSLLIIGVSLTIWVYPS